MGGAPSEKEVKSIATYFPLSVAGYAACKERKRDTTGNILDTRPDGRQTSVANGRNEAPTGREVAFSLSGFGAVPNEEKRNLFIY